MPQANMDRVEWDRSESPAPPDEAVLAFRGLRPAAPDSWGESRRDGGPVRLFSRSENTDAKLAKLQTALMIGVAAFLQALQAEDKHSE